MMYNNDPAMCPATIFINPESPLFSDSVRKWQAAPSVEVTKGGRVFVDFYGGDQPEVPGNYVKAIISDNGGKSFEDGCIVVSHPSAEIRLYDPNLWIDPLGRLWLLWNQSRGFNDGRIGVWGSICENPDADVNELSFSLPRRLANGIMINKPTVLSNGDWLFPCAIWSCEKATEDHGLQNEFFSNVYISKDQGETFSLLGHADIPNRSFDEHMLYEKNDGVIWMLVRSFDGIGESFSSDGGRTWSPGKKCHIDGPCSRFFIRRLRSGRLLMVNHYQFKERIDLEDIKRQGPVKSWRGRTNLTAMISEDEGQTWKGTLLLDPRNDAAYPDAKEGDDGFVYITYDWQRVTQREILLAKVTEQEILEGHLSHSNSFLRHVINKATGV
ncbi:sialidase family protein [Youxingia wuxianensis]|uniref:Exo-alpha-sialidase n=1 Tax=Youxingia wuxianensis TaxID=2763678 RepID=A0A926ELP3_9FIRM|nr:sialidase family protein [Youxingia wuxianensis]MBC8584183.1 exo-alpha-sialidase [Youxingia wuxianensis]